MLSVGESGAAAAASLLPSPSPSPSSASSGPTALAAFSADAGKRPAASDLPRRVSTVTSTPTASPPLPSQCRPHASVSPDSGRQQETVSPQAGAAREPLAAAARDSAAPAKAAPRQPDAPPLEYLDPNHEPLSVCFAFEAD